MQGHRFSIIFSLLTISLFLFPSSRTARAESKYPLSGPVQSCQLEGAFRKIIVDQLGTERAEGHTSYGLMVLEEDSGKVLCEEYVEPEKTLYPASSIKTLIATAILRKLDQGKLTLDDPIKINQVNAAEECQDWGCNEYGPGKIVKLGKLLGDMITVSNNLATNQLIDVATKPFINETSDLLRTPTLRVYRKMYNRVDPEPQNPKRNMASASGLVHLYKEIATGELGVLTESSRLHLVEVLRNQKIHN